MAERLGPQVFGPGLVSLIACARVDLHRGDTELALENTRRALDIYRAPSPVAFPWLAAQSAIGIGRLLVDLGEVAHAERMAIDARRHLAVLGSAGTLGPELEDLLAALRDARHRVEAEDSSHLTKAEIRVLQLLPTHLSLSDIGDELVVSRNTVKSQVTAIYRKLDVSGRREAVRKAHELGLLSEHPRDGQ
jgi:LuxR family transcriptional regulator, maltose regulon positive regulatory protein